MKQSILTVLICVLAATAAADERPHIVLVMADDHGYDDTGFTGHPCVQDAASRRHGTGRCGVQANDLSATESKRVAAMKKELEAWQRSVLASWSGADYQKRSQEN